jgi:putative flippase GtrA
VRTQLSRFLVAGVCTALCDYSTYRLLLWLDVPITPAKAAGLIVGTTLAYLVNRAWTFEADHHAVGRFLGVYAVSLLANLATNAIVLALLSGVTGAITLGWLAAQAVASTINFLGMRYVVFADRSVHTRG